MNFDFTDDQEQLRDAVRKWVDKGYSFDRRREAVSAGGFSRTAFNEMAELGLCGLYVSEADGGMGMGPVEGMVAMEAGWQGDTVGAAYCAPLASTYFNMRKTTIYGGSNEVQRNIIAQTVLG